jgi:hypothetical protein
MIEAVAFCPHPPVLVPEVAQGAAPELAALRAACRAAITRIALPGRMIVVLGGGPVSKAYESRARGTFAGYGVPLEVSLGRDGTGPVELPLALTVGAWLLHEAGSSAGAAFSIGADDADIQLADGRVALLVMGDASARRSTAAPGYLDERAVGYDAAVAEALASGDPAALARLDTELGAELLAAGAPVWRTVARLVRGRYDAEVLYDDAPYGVGYLVATWLARQP